MSGGREPLGGSQRSRQNRAPSPDFEDLSPERTFAILSSERRLSILRAIWNAPEELVPFSEIGRAPYVERDNLDYHLDKLVDHFVRRTDEGYALRHAGEQVMRIMLTGVFEDPASMDETPVDTRCPFCGGAVVLSYADDRLVARCLSCPGVTRHELPEGTFLAYGYPPAGLDDRSSDEILEAAHVLYDSKITPMMNGVCPECASNVAHSFDICEEHDHDETGLCRSCGHRFETWTEYRCVHCAYRRKCPLWFKVLLEPAVIAFCHEHGGLQESVPFSKLTWRNAAYVRDITATVEARDPLEFRVGIPIDDVRLTVRIDEDLNVLDVTRTDPKGSLRTGP